MGDKGGKKEQGKEQWQRLTVLMLIWLGLSFLAPTNETHWPIARRAR